MKKTIFTLLFTIISIVIFGQNMVKEIPFRLTKYNNILVPVIINQKDTVQLMLHTGSDYISIIDDSYKKMKSISISDTLNNVTSWAGYSDMKMSQNNVIKFGNEEFSKIPIFIDKQSGHESDGKIGLKFFEGKYLEINFDENKLYVYDIAPTKLKKYTKLNSRYSQETLYIKAFPFIDKKPIETEFMIHTGFSSALMISDDFAKEYKLLEKFEIIGESKLSDAAGNVRLSKKSILPDFELANQTFKNVPMSFFDSTIKIQHKNIMGGDLIKRFNLILNPEKDILYVKKSKYYKDEYFKL
ncbi:aspartyl protease family protein [Empedobacter sp. UBA7248]|uniref:aspartyl protease family protein n=1 Tax=Empedobacter sp. UBA7248 TaxID=1946448 RepID=UPI0025C447F9|nr:aspartyl protease family protein [Empedobacter sp. UBA7248]